MRVPGATYRLQFRQGVGFEEARRLVPYLDQLGVTDLYASPVFAARRGSTHGYDVTDPTRLDPELGTREEFEALAADLRARGMGLVLDMVPNHMAMSVDNPWWTDVLEHGRASRYAGFFDIDWAAPGLEGRVLVPVLAAPYGEVLDRGELSLVLDGGSLRIRYGDHRFPVDPATYGRVFGPQLLEVEPGPGRAAEVLLRGVIRAIARVPARRLTGTRSVERRARAAQALRERIRQTVEGSPEARAVLQRAVRANGGDPSKDSSRERLDELIADQAYLLSYWRAAAHEVDYRRFFDVTELVSLRAQDPAVFEATHALVLDLVRQGHVTGLRVDHVDGLHDAQAHLERLRSNLADGRRRERGFVVVEKILAEAERLRESWPVAGTSGYDFLESVGAVLVDAKGVAELGSAYERITGLVEDFPEVAAAQKRKVLRLLFESEVGALALRLQRLAREDRHGRDLTQADLGTALVEVTAALPVYRTYLRRTEADPEDRRVLERAFSAAEGRIDREASGALSFLRRILLLEAPPGRASRWLGFAMRWQQLTGPVTAKGVEDTAMYVYGRLLSRNDVGTDPGVAGIGSDEFHRRMRYRRRSWPDTMNATSTHDTKRSEDVRARLNVMSGLAGEWATGVERWMRINARSRVNVAGAPAPDPNEEWQIYQTLVGAWPLDRRDERGFPDRVAEFVRKALREAKVHSGWIDPDLAYEAAVERFVRTILRDQRFRRAFVSLRDRLALHGAWAGLSQVVIKITAPGIPDLYQGTELWALSLVDPDNRRPVDFEARRRMLAEMDDEPPAPEALLETWRDGRIKLWVTSRSLRFRRANGELFSRGVYLPLKVTGPGRGQVLAFARRRRQSWAVTVASTRTAGTHPRVPIGEGAWGTTSVTLPASASRAWTDVLTGEIVADSSGSGAPKLRVSQALGRLPVALLAGGETRVEGRPGAVR